MCYTSLRQDFIISFFSFTFFFRTMNKPQRFLSNRFLRLHLIVIYLLLLGLTIVWTLFYLYLIRIIRFQHFEYNRIEKTIINLRIEINNDHSS